MASENSGQGQGRGSTAFLLSQVGAQAAADFAERLTGLALSPAHAGIMRTISWSEGLSQRALAKTLGILPSRLVILVDELEARDLIERRSDPSDRRTHALHLTEAGQEMMGKLREIAQAHDRDTCAALTAEEKATLSALLLRLAEHQGLAMGVHPGYRAMGRKGSSEE